MSLYKDFLALGYTDSEALELAHLAEDFEDCSVADIESDEATKIIIDKFNDLIELNDGLVSQMKSKTSESCPNFEIEINLKNKGIDIDA